MTPSSPQNTPTGYQNADGCTHKTYNQETYYTDHQAIRVACGVVRFICYVPSLDDESEQWYKINEESEMVVVEPLNDDWDCYLFSG
jgi:hypothetical protein